MRFRYVHILTMSAILLTIVVGRIAVAATPDQPNGLAKDESEGIIFERQQVMLQLEKDTDTLGMIVSGLAPKDKLAQTTRSIAQSAKDAVISFQPKVAGGRAKPEVWTNNSDFMERMERFSKNAEGMAKAGETGNVSEVSNLMIEALPCKQCHDLYREPKKR